MTYLLYRIKESRGFVASRCFYNACAVVLLVYGTAIVRDRQIFLPNDLYIPLIEKAKNKIHKEMIISSSTP